MAVIITPVDDKTGKISQQSFLVKKTWLQKKFETIWQFTVHIMALMFVIDMVIRWVAG